MIKYDTGWTDATAAYPETYPDRTDYGCDDGVFLYYPVVCYSRGPEYDYDLFYEITSNQYQAQWILREFPWKIEPPELMPITRKAVKWKMMRCNRKGMGLRIRRDN